MEQTKALNALEPFLALSKSASSPRAAADLIIRATSAPNTYVFAELLQTPQIQALSSSSEFSSHLSLLQIFSYGTYESYSATQNLPALNEAQTLKLRQLSLLTLASDRSKLSYTSLKRHLNLSSAREVEDLVITAIYAGLLEATLDPAREAVQVTRIAPLRDLSPGSVPAMIAALKGWSSRCTSTIADIEAHSETIRSAATTREKEQRMADEKLKRQMEGLQALGKLGQGGRDVLPRRGMNKRSMFEGAGQPADEGSMDLDPATWSELGARGSKRKI